MPLRELIEQKVTAGTGPLKTEMEPLDASDETIPLFPNQLVKLGRQVKKTSSCRSQRVTNFSMREVMQVPFRVAVALHVFFFSFPGAL